jgi:hypothetical protein
MTDRQAIPHLTVSEKLIISQGAQVRGLNINHVQGLKGALNRKVGKESPAFTGSPTVPTPASDASGNQIVNAEFVNTVIQAAVDNLVGGAPGALDTLKEIADAINNDVGFNTAVTGYLAGKLDASADEFGGNAATASDAKSGSTLADTLSNLDARLTTVEDTPPVTGATGAAGANGVAGVAGPAGVAGANGVTGIDGAAGDAGLDGSNGPAGAKGIVGITGAGTNYGNFLSWNSNSTVTAWTVMSSSINIGLQTGMFTQGGHAVAVGISAGMHTQGRHAVAVGINTGYAGQGANSVAIGNQAGYINQRENAVAIGLYAGNINQRENAVAIGLYAGYSGQGTQAVAIGRQAGQTGQGQYAVALGFNAGYSRQGTQAMAIGNSAGYSRQGTQAMAIGIQAGYTGQGQYAVAVGGLAGFSRQGTQAIAIGYYAGRAQQGSGAVAVGYYAGNTNQGTNAVAIGYYAGQSTQGINAVAIGGYAGQSTQGINTVAIGYYAGQSTQGINAVAIGGNAGAIQQGTNAVAIGYQAGYNGQAANAVAIGNFAGQSGQLSNTIIINATGSTLNGTSGVTGSFYVNPVNSRAIDTGNSNLNVLMYDTANSEIVRSSVNTSSYDKTFVIDHPTNDKKYLVHACIEGPESGVYYRGIGGIVNNLHTTIQLPEYVEHLATEFTIQVTPIYSGKQPEPLYTSGVENNSFIVYGENCKFYWHVTGKRSDITIEPSRDTKTVHGSGPYKWIS